MERNRDFSIEHYCFIHHTKTLETGGRSMVATVTLTSCVVQGKVLTSLLSRFSLPCGGGKKHSWSLNKWKVRGIYPLAVKNPYNLSIFPLFAQFWIYGLSQPQITLLHTVHFYWKKYARKWIHTVHTNVVYGTTWLIGLVWKLNELTHEKDLRLFKVHNRCLCVLNWKSIAATIHVEIFTNRGSQNPLNKGEKKVQMKLFTKQESQM